MEHNLDLPVKDVIKIIQRSTRKSRYFGVRARKYPTDFWMYQEIITRRKPDVIVEFGVQFGGSLLAYAHMCDLLGHGKVIGVDKTLKHVSGRVRKHRRITLIEDFALDAFDLIRELIPEDKRAILIEDSSHQYDNTLNILRKYSEFVKKGDYFIVEDGVCHHGIDYGPSPGPYEAIETFLKENDSFLSDRSMEKFFITSSPTGFLRRVKEEKMATKKKRIRRKKMVPISVLRKRREEKKKK